MKASCDKVAVERDGLKTDKVELEERLAGAVGENSKLVAKLTALGQNVDKLLGAQDKMAKEREALAAQVDELKRMRAAADARDGEYRSLLGKLRAMIDAGTLQVKIRGGRMVVQMSSDLLFPAGGTKLRPDARKAVVDLAATLKSFPDRKFQVVGHSDSTPINSARFPSNWELSAERAIEVVKVLIESGVQASTISAAENAEFDPLVENRYTGAQRHEPPRRAYFLTQARRAARLRRHSKAVVESDWHEITPVAPR